MGNAAAVSVEQIRSACAKKHKGFSSLPAGERLVLAMAYLADKPGPEFADATAALNFAAAIAAIDSPYLTLTRWLTWALECAEPISRPVRGMVSFFEPKATFGVVEGFDQQTRYVQTLEWSPVGFCRRKRRAYWTWFITLD